MKKFTEVPGEWLSQWGTNSSGTGQNGLLVYQPNENFDNPENIPSRGSQGTYLITVDLRSMEYAITEK